MLITIKRNDDRAGIRNRMKFSVPASQAIFR
jgi:hypothetical protein